MAQLGTLLLLGVVIGANNLATALALGALGQAGHRARILLAFGVFEFFVPLIGIWLGQHASIWLVDHTTWLGPVLLGLLGLGSVVTGIRGSTNDTVLAQRLTSPGGIVLLAAGMSLDNLVIGFSLGLRQISALVMAATICTFSVSFSWLGLSVGDAARRHWERPAEIGAGSLLVALAVLVWLGWV